jgi:hypothetical protein
MGVKVPRHNDGGIGLEVRLDEEEGPEVRCVVLDMVIKVDQVKGLVADRQAKDLEGGRGGGVGHVGVNEALRTVRYACVCCDLGGVVEWVMAGLVEVPKGRACGKPFDGNAIRSRSGRSQWCRTTVPG